VEESVPGGYVAFFAAAPSPDASQDAFIVWMAAKSADRTLPSFAKSFQDDVEDGAGTSCELNRYLPDEGTPEGMLLECRNGVRTVFAEGQRSFYALSQRADGPLAETFRRMEKSFALLP
jgi:hypothetical protein